MSTAPPPARGFPLWAPLAAFLVAVGTSGIAFALIASVSGSDDGGGVVIGATVVQNVTLVGAMIVLAGMGGARVTPATFGLRRVDPRDFLGPAVAIFVIFYVFLVAWSQLDPGAEDDLLEDLGAKDSTLALIATGFMTLLLAPVAEELFFRGFLFGALRDRMDWRLAAVPSGILFGAVHLGTPVIFLVPLAVFGVLLCVLYQRTGSLVPGMGVHAFNNGLAFGVGFSWPLGEVLLVALGAAVAVTALATAFAADD